MTRLLKLREIFEALDLASADVDRVQASPAQDQLDTVLSLGLAEESTLLSEFAKAHNEEVIDTTECHFAFETIERLGVKYCVRKLVIPLLTDAETQEFATSRPWSEELSTELAFLLGTPVKLVGASAQSLRAALETFDTDTSINSSAFQDEDALRLAAQDGPVAKAVADAIDDAVAIGASDLHFEVTDKSIKLRTRLHGNLQRRAFDRTLNPFAVLARLKVLAGMNVTETRLPQDGRIQLVTSGRKIDLRVSSIPTSHGESIVCRILDPKSLQRGWSDLGFDDQTSQKLIELIEKPNGLFLVTGPTGSGKTTTLYTALRHLNSEGRKILTIEDPIEYELDGVEQVQVHEEIGMTFANALRSFLRQDPNVIMVGEIRDEETAEMACRAALIGRMVLSTLHTNSADGAITRLKDLGVPEYILEDVLRGVLAQRLDTRKEGQRLSYELNVA